MEFLSPLVGHLIPFIPNKTVNRITLQPSFSTPRRPPARSSGVPPPAPAASAAVTTGFTSARRPRSAPATSDSPSIGDGEFRMVRTRGLVRGRPLFGLVAACPTGAGGCRARQVGRVRRARSSLAGPRSSRAGTSRRGCRAGSGHGQRSCPSGRSTISLTPTRAGRVAAQTMASATSSDCSGSKPSVHCR